MGYIHYVARIQLNNMLQSFNAVMTLVYIYVYIYAQP
jgi:hypothetical protein